VCALAACSVIVEQVVAFTLAQSFCEKFGHDSLVEMQARYQAFHELARAR
jgi:chorismate synthase